MCASTHAGPYVSAAQVLRRLAEIEQEGVEFYEGLKEGTQSEWIRAFADKLVRAEKRHHDRFLSYAEKAEAHARDAGDTLREPLPAEVRRLLEKRIMAPRERIQKSAPYARDEEALRIALRAEESLALLLTELREYVPKDQRPYISRVIKEEWAHKEHIEKLLKQKMG